MTTFYRHGDVCIVTADSMETQNVKPKNDNVLLEGEVTGHAHRLGEGATVLRHQSPSQNNLYLLGSFKTKKATPLSHEEHKTITFKKGTYKFYGQREYDPVQEHMVRD